jgi:hypothetical protein
VGIVAIVVSVTVGRTSSAADADEIVPVVDTSPSPSPSPDFRSLPFEPLLDTFTEPGSGSGNLDAHFPESGGPWMVWNSQPQLQIEFGQGYASAVTDSWNSAPSDFTDAPDQKIVVTFEVPGAIAGAESAALVAVGWANEITGNGVGFVFRWDPAAGEYTTSINNIVAFAHDTPINSPAPISGTVAFDTPLTLTATVAEGNKVTLDFENGTQFVSGTSTFDSVTDNYDVFTMSVSRIETETDHIRLTNILVAASDE